MVLERTLKEVDYPTTNNQQLGQDSHDHQEVMAQTSIPQDNNPHPQGFNTTWRLAQNDRLFTQDSGSTTTLW